MAEKRRIKRFKFIEKQTFEVDEFFESETENDKILWKIVSFIF